MHLGWMCSMNEMSTFVLLVHFHSEEVLLMQAIHTNIPDLSPRNSLTQITLFSDFMINILFAETIIFASIPVQNHVQR